MSYSCSQCDFTSNFESALVMHHQLHHEGSPQRSPRQRSKESSQDKAYTVPRTMSLEHATKEERGLKMPARSSSATRMFDRLKARICKSRQTLFVHPEEGCSTDMSAVHFNRTHAPVSKNVSSRTVNLDQVMSKHVRSEAVKDSESYGCHLCTFVADRITVLDRHLLNDHEIGIENLLKLVMSKTKEGLSEPNDCLDMLSIQRPYYKPVDEIIEDCVDFVVENVMPKIKILRHAAVNTEISMKNLPEDFKAFPTDYEGLEQDGPGTEVKGDFVTKMKKLSEYMGRFVDSSIAIKKVLSREYRSKHSIRGHMSNVEEPVFDLGLGSQDTPRDWDRPHSEKFERTRQYRGGYRSEKPRLMSESFYF